MATRLTSTHKQQIIFAVLNHAFGYRNQCSKEREQQLANEVYASLYTPEQIKQMNELGANFFQPQLKVFIRMPKENGYATSRSFEFGGVRIFGHHTLQRDLKYSDFGTAPGTLGMRLTAYFDISKNDENEKEGRRRELSNALDGFGTIRQLRLAWPELVPVLDKLGLESTPRNLPVVVDRSTLNNALGLPPK